MTRKYFYYFEKYKEYSLVTTNVALLQFVAQFKNNLLYLLHCQEIVTLLKSKEIVPFSLSRFNIVKIHDKLLNSKQKNRAFQQVLQINYTIK